MISKHPLLLFNYLLACQSSDITDFLCMYNVHAYSSFHYTVSYNGVHILSVYLVHTDL